MLKKRRQNQCFKIIHQTLSVGIIHYNRSVRIIHLVSPTTCGCVLILYIIGGYLQFKVDSERLIREIFHGEFIYSESICQKSAERKSLKKYFLYFVLMSGLEMEPWLYGNKYIKRRSHEHSISK